MLKWIKPRNKVFYCIDIDSLEAWEKDNKDAKSLTEKDAEEISFIISEHV